MSAARALYIVDGTLLPCWSWATHPRLYSGKHKTTGMNVQVVCTLDGELVWISDPIEGARHDVFCLDESGALHTLDPRDWTGDKGYVGRGMITPIKKIPELELLDWQKNFNTAINRTRAVVERVIANLKNWRILHTAPCSCLPCRPPVHALWPPRSRGPCARAGELWSRGRRHRAPASGH